MKLLLCSGAYCEPSSDLRQVAGVGGHRVRRGGCRGGGAGAVLRMSCSEREGMMRGDLVRALLLRKQLPAVERDNCEELRRRAARSSERKATAAAASVVARR